MSSYSNLKFEIIDVGGSDGAWGGITNTNIGTAIEQAIVGMATLATGDFTSNVATLTLTNTNAAQDARAACLNITATLSAAGTVNVPAIEKPYIIINGSSGGYAVTVKVSGQTGVAIPNGKACIVYNNGTDVVDAINYMSSLTLGTDLAVTEGGTGASSASGARTNLGATTLGANLFTITNPSAVTFPRFNADNTVSALNAADFRTAIGAGTGGGSVTSVAGTGTVNGITLTGTVTSSGSLTLGGTLTGVNLTSQVTGTLPVANGGTGVTTSTGSGNVVLSTSPTLVTPVLGTPSSGTLSSCTVDGTNAVGFRNIPPVGTKTSSYTLAVSDIGKYVQVSTGGSIVVPDATFSEGDVISIFNNTTGDITITLSITTAYIAGTDTDKASVALATRGVATILFISGTVCVVNGNVS